MDRKFSQTEQYEAEMAQAFAIVLGGQSHNQLEQPWTMDFIGALRSDYVPLTRKSIGPRIAELEKRVRGQVPPPLWEDEDLYVVIIGEFGHSS